MAESGPGEGGQRLGLVRQVVAGHLREEGVHLVLGAVQNRRDHVSGAITHRLHDKLAKVGLHDVNAGALERGVE